MKLRLPLLLLSLLAVCLTRSFAQPSAGPAVAADSRIYELRTYHTHPGKLGDLLARFRHHTTRLFEKHGMVNVGYWVPMRESDGASTTLIYVLAHASREAATVSWKAFGADPEWKAVRTASEEAGKIVSKVESVFLTPTDYSPPVKSSVGPSPRVFELRTYTTPEGRLDALDSRFRQHTLKLFSRHGMTHIAYFHPTDSNQGAGRTLLYFLAHASQSAAEASWKAFRENPEWKAAREASEKQAGGSLTLPQPDGVRSVFLLPTDFSATR